MVTDCAFVSIAAEYPDCNEDAVALEPELGIFVVADGVGGRPAAALASRLAADTFVAAFRRVGSSALDADVDLVLKRAVRHANSALFDAGLDNPTLRGMSSTLTALVIDGARARAVHVGDCRLYCYSDGRLSQLTTDHNIAAELGEADPQKAKALQRILTRALGFVDDVRVEAIETAVRIGDIFILATDGLEKSLPYEDMLDAIRRTSEESAQGICDELRQLATSNVLIDDVSFCVVKPMVERSECNGTA